MNNHSEVRKLQFTLIQKQVMATGFTGKYRDKLIDIERQIKNIAGCSSDDCDKWSRDLVKFNYVKSLLAKRWNLLNMMFQPSDMNMKRFRK